MQAGKTFHRSEMFALSQGIYLLACLRVIRFLENPKQRGSGI